MTSRIFFIIFILKNQIITKTRVLTHASCFFRLALNGLSYFVCAFSHQNMNKLLYLTVHTCADSAFGLYSAYTQYLTADGYENQ